MILYLKLQQRDNVFIVNTTDATVTMRNVVLPVHNLDI